jgi:hypothetical protein
LSKGRDRRPDARMIDVPRDGGTERRYSDSIIRQAV